MRAGDDAIRPGARLPSAARACLVALAVASGCRRAAEPPPLPPAEATTTTPAPAVAEPPRAFEPPDSLATLDGQVSWVDRPVRDALALAREQEAREPPSCSLAEALALANDSPEANARIVAALFSPPAAATRVGVERVDRHLVTDVGSLNPLLAESAADFDVLSLTGLDLFGFDRSLAAFANADVVAAWQTSTDGLVDKIVLRDDLVWSDGAPVTAADVAFSWRLAVDPRVSARAFRDGAARIRAVRAYDDRTVVMFHAEPLATAVWDIGFPLVPRHVYAATWERDPTLVTSAEHAGLEARPVTGGPYEVVTRAVGREIVLRRREAWSTVDGRKVREPPPIAEIRFRVLEDPIAALESLGEGALDEAVLAPEQWSALAADARFTERALRLMTSEWQSMQVAWNIDTPPFADRRVRRAMGYAFDHDRLLDGLCHGLATPATGPFPPGSWVGSRRRTEPSRQDLVKAEALLDEAGWIDHDGDGVRDKEIDGRTVPCEFTMLCDRRPLHVAVAALWRECLARIGVNCNVRSMEPREVREALHARRFDACLVSLGAGIDPDSAASIWSAGGARNDCGYANPDVDHLFAEGRRERDRERRAERYGRIEELLLEDQPCTWLVWQRELRGVSRRVAGDLFWLRGNTHWSPGLSSIWKPALE